MCGGEPLQSSGVQGVDFGRKSMENRTENFQPDCFQAPSVASTPPNGRVLTQLFVRSLVRSNLRMSYQVPVLFFFTIDGAEEA